MAINKYLKRTIKKLSYYDIDLKRNYELLRKVRNLVPPPAPRSSYRFWNHKVFALSDGHEIPIRIFSPGCETQGMSILLFFHGGGWVIGNIDNYSRICAGMAKMTGSIVISVDYRLAPEHRFPQGLNDCYDATSQLYNNLDFFNTTPDKITLIGDSAGGNLAAAVSLMRRDNGQQVPSKQILIYPATFNDHTATSPFFSVKSCGSDYLLTAKRVQDYMELYASDVSDMQNPYLAPLLAKDLSNQPNTLALTAEFDPLRDEGEAYARALASAGNKVELHRIADALHGFFALPPRSAPVSRCYHYINSFLVSNDTF